MRRAIVAALAAVSLAAVALCIVWLRQNSVEVYVRFSGRVTDAHSAVGGARTFRAKHGHLLTTMPESRSAPYIYLPEVGQVLLCNSNTFLSLGVAGLQKRDRDGRYPCAGSGKQELQQQIERTETSLAFNSWRNGKPARIQVSW
jgi:hypothetical protein